MERHELLAQIQKHCVDNKINDPKKYLKKVLPKTYKALQVWYLAERQNAKRDGVGAEYAYLEWDARVLTNRVNDFIVEVVKHVSVPTDIRKNLDNGIAYRIEKKSPELALDWVVGRVGWVGKALDVLPEPYHRLNTEKKRRRLANELAARCAQCINFSASSYSRPIDAVEFICDTLGLNLWLCNDTPQKKRYKRKAYGQAKAGRARAQAREDERAIYFLSDIQNDAFWRRKINNAFMVATENARRAVGMVCANVSPYASHTARAIIATRNEKQKEWMRNTVVVSGAGESISLADIHKRSLANPEVRRAELMTRISGLEQYSKEENHIAVFVTMTAPSEFHRLKKRGSWFIDNPNWAGADAKDAQEWLKKSWSRFRTDCNDTGCEFYGLRVVEPHIDGTPHWHGVFFMHPDNVEFFTDALERRQCELNSDELYFADSGKPKTKAIKARVDVKLIDSKKGSAVGYIAKYISKNIDGHGMDGLKDDESGRADIKSNVDAVTAWSRINRFRQFQFIGAGSATVWRELRRIDQPIAMNDNFENMRSMADSGDYAGFFRANKDKIVTPVYVSYTDIKTGKLCQKLHGLKCAGGLVEMDFDIGQLSDEDLFSDTPCYYAQPLELSTREKVWEIKKGSCSCSSSSSLGLVSLTVERGLKFLDESDFSLKLDSSCPYGSPIH